MPAFEGLLDFVQHKMRMSHIYQPVMLMSLLNFGGTATVRQIATQFAQRDEALIEYYSKITKEMPGRVLGQNHGIVKTLRGKGNSIVGYSLIGYSVSRNQKSLLIGACQAKYEEYLDSRGQKIYQHRRMASGYLSGTLKSPKC